MPQKAKSDLDIEITLGFVKRENIFLNHLWTFLAEILHLEILNDFWISAFYRTQNFQVVWELQQFCRVSFASFPRKAFRTARFFA